MNPNQTSPRKQTHNPSLSLRNHGKKEEETKNQDVRSDNIEYMREDSGQITFEAQQARTADSVISRTKMLDARPRSPQEEAKARNNIKDPSLERIHHGSSSVLEDHRARNSLFADEEGRKFANQESGDSSSKSETGSHSESTSHNSSISTDAQNNQDEDCEREVVEVESETSSSSEEEEMKGGDHDARRPVESSASVQSRDTRTSFQFPGSDANTAVEAPTRWSLSSASQTRTEDSDCDRLAAAWRIEDQQKVISLRSYFSQRLFNLSMIYTIMERTENRGHDQLEFYRLLVPLFRALKDFGRPKEVYYDRCSILEDIRMKGEFEGRELILVLLDEKNAHTELQYRMINCERYDDPDSQIRRIFEEWHARCLSDRHLDQAWRLSPTCEKCDFLRETVEYAIYLSGIINEQATITEGRSLPPLSIGHELECDVGELFLQEPLFDQGIFVETDVEFQQNISELRRLLPLASGNVEERKLGIVLAKLVSMRPNSEVLLLWYALYAWFGRDTGSCLARLEKFCAHNEGRLAKYMLGAVKACRKKNDQALDHVYEVQERGLPNVETLASTLVDIEAGGLTNEDRLGWDNPFLAKPIFRDLVETLWVPISSSKLGVGSRILRFLTYVTLWNLGRSDDIVRDTTRLFENKIDDDFVCYAHGIALSHESPRMKQKMFKEACKSNPRNEQYKKVLLDLIREKKNRKEKEELRLLSEEGFNDDVLLLRQAELAESAKDWQTAEKYYDEAQKFYVSAGKHLRSWEPMETNFNSKSPPLFSDLNNICDPLFLKAKSFLKRGALHEFAQSINQARDLNREDPFRSLVKVGLLFEGHHREPLYAILYKTDRSGEADFSALEEGFGWYLLEDFSNARQTFETLEASSSYAVVSIHLRILTKLSRTREALELCDQFIAENPEDPRARKEKGYLLEKESNWGRAPTPRSAPEEFDKLLGLYDRKIESDPDNSEPYENKGNLLRKAKQYERALACYEAYVRLDPTRKLGYLLKADLLKEMKEHEEAVLCYDKCISLDPNVWEYQSKVNLLKQMKRHEEVERTLDSFIHSNPHENWGYEQKVNMLVERKDHEKALVFCDKWIQSYPGKSLGYEMKSNVLRMMNEHIRALDCYDAFIASNPTGSWGYEQKERWLGEMDDDEKIMAHYDTYIKLYPENKWGFEQKGDLLEKKRKFEEALTCYNDYIKLYPKKEWGYQRKGDVLEKMQKFEEALTFYNDYIKLWPKKGWGYQRKGDLLEKRREYTNALACCDDYIKLHPKRDWGYQRKGGLLEEMKKFEEALTCYDNYIKLYPKKGWGYQRKGVLLEKMKEHKKAQICYDDYIKFGSWDTWGYQRKGDLFEKMKKNKEALVCYNDYIKLHSLDKWGYQRKANLLEKMEEYRKALACYDHCIRLPNVREWGYQRKGDLLERIEDYQEALDCYDDSIKFCPQKKWGYQRKSDLLEKMKMFKDALVCYDHYIKLHSWDEWGFQRKGDLLEKMKKYNEALGVYDHYIKLRPGNEWGYKRKGNLLEKMEEYRKALACYDDYSIIDPNREWGYRRRGDLLRRMDESAESLTQDFIANDYQEWIHQQRGDLFERREEYIPALVCYDDYIKLYPNQRWGYTRKDNLLKRIKEDKPAQGCSNNHINSRSIKVKGTNGQDNLSEEIIEANEGVIINKHPLVQSAMRPARTFRRPKGLFEIMCLVRALCLVFYLYWFFSSQFKTLVLPGLDFGEKLARVFDTIDQIVSEVSP